MARTSKGAYLYRRIRKGWAQPVWLIIDGPKQIVVGRGDGDRSRAERQLGEYLAAKHKPLRDGDPETVLISYVLNHYFKKKAPLSAAPKTLAHTITPLQQFWIGKPVAAINGLTCRDYASWRTQQARMHYNDSTKAPRVSSGTARREVAILGAAVNFAHKEGILLRSVPVTLPPLSSSRERHMSREEAAALLSGAMGFYKDKTGRVKRTDPDYRSRHLCRFILIGLYTGTRHDAILRLRWTKTPDDGWIDVKKRIIHRRGEAERQTKKRRPPMPIPKGLLPHILRWHQMDMAAGVDNVIAFNGEPIKKQRTAWNAAVIRAGLSDDITPHTMRHTCATWLLGNNVAPWQVAGYLGTTAKVIYDTYGHHILGDLRDAGDTL